MNQTESLAPAQNGQTKPQDLRSFISGNAFKSQVALALPKHMTPDRFARIALTAMTKTPMLLECTRDTLLRCLMDCSQLGLEPDGRHAHLIPFKNNRLGIVECQLIIDYKGLMALARRSGDVSIFRAELVKEYDDFEWVNGIVSHRVDWRRSRGETQCVYSYVKFKDGSEDFEVMTLDEVKAIKGRSRAANSGPWVTDFDEMAKKTVLRRHSKRLTLSPEFADAVDKDDDRSERTVAGREIPAAQVPQMFGNALPPASEESPPVDDVRASETKAGRKSRTAREDGASSGDGLPPAQALWARCDTAGFDQLAVLAILRDNALTDAEFPADLTDTDAEAAMQPKIWDVLVKLMKGGSL